MRYKNIINNHKTRKQKKEIGKNIRQYNGNNKTIKHKTRKPKNGKNGKNKNGKKMMTKRVNIGGSFVDTSGNTKVFNSLNCAPSGNKEHFTCYKTTALDRIKLQWNARHPDKKIEETEPKKIWENLRDMMQHVCTNEACWLSKLFRESEINDELLNYTFSPPMPKSWLVNPREWLSSIDIIAVMKQFEKEFKCFVFMGPSPINYDTHRAGGRCVWEELCEFNLEQHISKSKMKIGIIFNLDPDYKSGSHWVSLFINIRKGEIYYFDSVGYAPDKQIKKFIDTVIKQGAKINIDFKYYENKVQHQKGDTECGMYSLFFIINMLNDIDFNIFEKKKFTDKEMEIFRGKYFNPLMAY